MNEHVSSVCTCNDCKCNSTTFTVPSPVTVPSQFKAWHLDDTRTTKSSVTLKLEPATRLAELQAKKTLTEGERLEVQHLLKLVWG